MKQNFIYDHINNKLLSLMNERKKQESFKFREFPKNMQIKIEFDFDVFRF